MNFDTTDPARTLTYRKDDRMEIFRALTVPEQSAAFAKLSAYVQQVIVKELSDFELVNLLDHMDMRQVEQALTRVPENKRRQRIIKRLKSDVRLKIDYFLRFHPQATLSHINFNYLFLDASLSIGETATIIDEYYAETGRYPEILVHSRGELLGEVSFASMVRERNSAPLKKYVIPVNTISFQADVSEIVDLISTTSTKKIIVLDHDTSVLGIIYAETVRPLFGELPAEALYEFTGVDDSERPFDSVRKKVFHRYRWLILNLATCFLAGSVILLFQATLNELTILTIYIPIIAGMAGNAASQSFAIMVRGISLGAISIETARPALLREMTAGLINGVIIGTIVTFISAVWNDQPLLGLVVGVAIACAQTIAVTAGATIPLVMKRLGKDPAATSSIFITTVTDVCGLLLLLGFATIFLL